MSTTVYVDGFNLYYRQLRERPQFKWLNPHLLAAHVLDPANVITKVRFYTARVSGKRDPDMPRRQQIYFDALKTVPEIEIHLGNFLVTKQWAGLVPPPVDPAKPNARPHLMPWPSLARIFKTEEKGSDVNLASHLVDDAHRNRFDVAVILTNDTDLTEPMRLVTRELGKTVGLITPVAKPASSLHALASFTIHLRDAHLAAAQFPNPRRRADGSELNRPPSWA